MFDRSYSFEFSKRSAPARRKATNVQVWRRVAPAVLFLAIGAAGPACAETFRGTLSANHLGRISAQIIGERSLLVKQMLARVGDRIKKGDLLAQIDTDQLKADREVAARALEESQAAVAAGKSLLVGTQLQLDRQAKLEHTVSFRRATFEDAQIAMRTATHQLQRAEHNAQVRKAEIERIDLEIAKADIVAPYDAIVMDVAANVGSGVTIANPDLMKLLDLSRVEIELAVPPDKIATLQPGRKVSYSFDDGKRHAGEVRAVLPAIEPGQGDRRIRVKIDSASLPLGFADHQAVTVVTE